MGDVILLIEDNEADAALASRALARSKLHNPIAWLQSAEESLEYLRGCQNDLPLLILLDLSLRPGGMDGVAFMQRVRSKAEWKHIPIIVLTADRHSMRRTFGLGAVAHLVKPVDALKLVDKVSELSLGWRLVAEIE